MEPGKNQSEREFLESYDLAAYDKPSVAADMVVFTIRNEKTQDIRKLPQKNLSLLLIRRGEHPFKDCWALPGGFVRKGETLEAAAYRELKEETGISDVYLSQLHSFSDINRDPRGWIISNAFLALAEEDLFQLSSGSDAADAGWFQTTYTMTGSSITDTPKGKLSKEQYQLRLTNSDITLEATVEKQTLITGRRKIEAFVLLDSNGLAFDHGMIISYAINYLRASLNSSMLAFELMPEYFTLTELQQVYEIILGEELFPANFRRKIAEYVTETEEWVKGTGYRPSKLFKRNYDKLL